MNLCIAKKYLPTNFGGMLFPDIKFLGFDITEKEASGDPVPSSVPSLVGGWYFVIEERVSEVRFGLDLSDNDQPPNIKKWDDLTWEHLNVEEGYYLSDEESDTSGLSAEDLNANSSSFACITMQKPVRIIVHARQMIPRRDK